MAELRKKHAQAERRRNTADVPENRMDKRGAYTQCTNSGAYH